MSENISLAEKQVIISQVNTWIANNLGLFIDLDESEKEAVFINMYPGSIKHAEISYNIWKNSRIAYIMNTLGML